MHLDWTVKKEHQYLMQIYYKWTVNNLSNALLKISKILPTQVSLYSIAMKLRILCKLVRIAILNEISCKKLLNVFSNEPEKQAATTFKRVYVLKLS